jgi:Kinesin motor domain
MHACIVCSEIQSTTQFCNGTAMQSYSCGRLIPMYRKATIPTTEFKFDEVLRQQSTQGDVYAAAVEPVVADVLNGYNGTVMAYGQTGVLKTLSDLLYHLTVCPRHVISFSELGVTMLHAALSLTMDLMLCRCWQDIHAIQPGT